MERAVADLLRRVTDALGGGAAPEPDRVVHEPRRDLVDPHRSLSIGSAAIADRLERIIARPPTLDALADGVRQACNQVAGRGSGPVALFADLAEARAGLAHGARTDRGGVVLAIGADTDGIPDPVERLPPGRVDLAHPRLRTGDIALLLIEPRGLASEPPAWSAALTVATRTATRVAFDESRTAFRTAAGAVCRDLRLAPDAVLLGPSAAGGLPFAAVVGLTDARRVIGLRPATLAVADATLAELTDASIIERLGEAGALLRAAFLTACANDGVPGSWCGPDALPELSFEARHDVSGDRIAARFHAEMARLGFRTGQDLAISSIHTGRALQQAADAIRTAVAQVGTGLVKHAAFLDGALPFPFPGCSAATRAAGLTAFRVPRMVRARIELPDSSAQVQVRFEPGELGPLATAGFYSPRLLDGDFVVHARLDLTEWKLGPDSASAALFAQTADGTRRLHAQLLSTAADPTAVEVAAVLEATVEGLRPIDGHGAELRLSRTARRWSAAWREHTAEPWAELAVLDDGPTDPVIVGVVLWSKIRSDGLAVAVSELAIGSSG